MTGITRLLFSVTSLPTRGFRHVIAALILAGAGAAAHAADQRHMLTVPELESRVADELESLGAGESVGISLIGRFNEVIHESKRPIHVQFQSLDYDARDMTWHGELKLFNGDTLAATLPIEGRYEALLAVPVLKHRLHRSDVIEKADITWEHVPEHRLRKDVIVSAEELIGMSPRRVISNGRAIRLSEIEKPVVMKRGDIVQIRYRTPKIEIRTLGEAMDDGATGERIRIRNSESNIVVRARVMGPGMAQVQDLMQLSLNERQTD